MPRPRRPVDLSPAALVRAGVLGVLAYDPGVATSGAWTLAAPRVHASDGDEEESPLIPNVIEGSLARVFVRGPTQQRSVEHMCGVSDGYDAIEARFREACSTVGVTDVSLELDTPGGDFAACFPTCERMLAVADEFRSRGGRVWSVADECSCSAGYALMLVADKGRVFCPRGGRTASIGMVRLVPNMKGALDLEGIEVTIFRSDDQKMVPSGIEPIDDATAAVIQTEVDLKADMFRTWVASRRGGKPEDYRAFKGASMLGEAALAAGLIDGNATAQEVAAMAGSEAALASIRGALGLPATATQQDMEAKASEGRIAIAQLSAAKERAALADAARLKLEEDSRIAAAAQAKATVRAAFVAEVVQLRTAARITPAAAASLLGVEADAAKGIAAVPGHYDVHGEASARSTLVMLTSATPIVPIGARPGAVPVPSEGASLTQAQKDHAKAICVSETEYAEKVLGKASGT